MTWKNKKILQQIKYLLHKERLKEKLRKQDFHYSMEEVFEPINTKQVEATENQKQLSENQIQALHDSSQTTRQAIAELSKNQTRAIKERTQESSNTLNDNLQKNLQYYNKITNRNNQLLTRLVNSNQVEYSIVKTVSNLLNDKNKSQFSLELITQIDSAQLQSPNLFTINPSNAQHVIINDSTLTLENGNSYILNDPDLQYLIINTKFDREINKKNIIYRFLNDMNHNINYGDKKSIRYSFIKDLYSGYQQLQSFAGSGLGSCTRSYANQSIFLPSDPDELVDRLKLLCFEKAGGSDSFLLNEQIMAIVDKLLECECTTPSQHQNLRSQQSTLQSLLQSFLT